MAQVTGLVFPNFSPRNVASIEMYWENMGIAARRVDKLGLDIRSFKVPLTRSIKEVVIPSIQINFHKHGRPRWAPLSEDTELKKGHAIPLHLTGALRGVMAQIGIWHIDREKALIPSLPGHVWYGGIHQSGASFGGSGMVSVTRIGLGRRPAETITSDISGVGGGLGGGDIPARPFAVIQKEDEERIEQIFGDWLGERINAAGLGPAGRVSG
jgi:phage gpG-like protein